MVLAEKAVLIGMWLFQRPNFVTLALLHANVFLYRGRSDSNKQVGVCVAISSGAV